MCWPDGLKTYRSEASADGTTKSAMLNPGNGAPTFRTRPFQESAMKSSPLGPTAAVHGEAS